MVVPVSLRPDRRGQVRTSRGWTFVEDTREYQEQKQRDEHERRHAHRVAERKMGRPEEYAAERWFERYKEQSNG